MRRHTHIRLKYIAFTWLKLISYLDGQWSLALMTNY